ncbi:Putative amidase domain-containing protein [Paenibacillus sp. UNCCL117]|uniref:amidase domain-containing protein n=1 Tax=unclassified Paenibacillus TaxID=185978 RepID=UPI0008890B2F|nr:MULTISPECIES: amidase domain-containing protein [unclassified Paenibacillus]SDE63647.1 Putative amidase domain-containing protein [Paenibacillus sp. cl123]SFW70066.1 Putative amidase domain-containing protein [Paenibacillus sp. UNCCL117]
MAWKLTLYDYIHHRNLMDIDYTVEPLLPIVQDGGFLHRQTRLLARRMDTDRERRLTPVKSETRLVIDRVEELPGRTIVDVTLKRKASSRIRETEQEEMRIERERITFHEGLEGWSILRVEMLQSEQNFRLKSSYPGSLVEVEEPALAEGEVRAPSVPFLNPLIVPELQHAKRAAYNRRKAAEYADLWWDKGNPDYLTFEVDCTNYVSQCLFAGGAPMNYTNKRESGWWYKGRSGSRELWSFSWAVADSLPFFLLTSRSGTRGEEVSSAGELDLGDVISYDWDGSGRFQHSTIVTAKDPDGMPLVNAHTVSSKHRYWSYTDSYAWTDKTRYRFVKIADRL